MIRPIVLLFLAAACTATPGDTSPAITEDRFDTGDLGTAEVSVVTVDDEALNVVVVSTPEARSKGLRAVEDLGDFDGMLFTWGGDTVTSRFTMEDTLISLDVSFFDADGRFVDGFTMTPCETDPCSSYAASAPYAYALEVPAGAFPGIGAGSKLSITD